jgi:hypothetical protein
VGQCTATGPLSLPREGATATLLNSGKVLVAGGNDVYPSYPGYASAEV